MTKCKTLKVKLSNSQLNKLKSGIKNGTKATLNFSSNLSGNFNGKANFLHKILITVTQGSKIRKVFANGSTANNFFFKNSVAKIAQLEGFLFGPLNIFG